MKFNNAFWKWFGDSKVVDENGDPLVVYHGTRANFYEFKRVADPDLGYHFGSLSQAEKRLSRTDKTQKGEWIIMPVYLSIQNPLLSKDAMDWHNGYSVWDALNKATKGALGPVTNWLWRLNESLPKSSPEETLELFRQKIFDLGFDGVMYKNKAEGSGISWIALDPVQIKSAIGNDGSWDMDDPDIRSNPRRKR